MKNKSNVLKYQNITKIKPIEEENAIMESLGKYKGLISELPVLNQKSVAQKTVWINDEHGNGILTKEHSSYINGLINSSGQIVISRGYIFAETCLAKKIIEIFVWGYPTGGRGRNIENCLERFNELKCMCESILNKDLRLNEYAEVIKEFKNINGLGPSTWTKFMYFFQTKIEGIPTLIFDAQIEKSLRHTQFEEFQHLADLRHGNANHFIDYIKGVDKIAKKLDVSTDRIELFLFYFNLNYMF